MFIFKLNSCDHQNWTKNKPSTILVLQRIKCRSVSGLETFIILRKKKVTLATRCFDFTLEIMQLLIINFLV